MWSRARCVESSGVRRSGPLRARARITASATVLASLLVAPSGPVRADPFHAQTLPLGQRAIGMGGAFVAVADDPSAAYHNPAGIAWTSDTSLSASLTLTAFDKSSVEGGYRTSAGSSSLNHNTGASLPVFVSAVKHLGRRDEERRRRHAIAISSFTVSQRRLGFDVEVSSETATGTALETLSIDQAERTAWHGFSYGYRPLRNLSFGLSGFLSIQRTHYGEERIGVGLGSGTSDGRFDAQRSAWTSHLVDTTVKSLLVRIGGLYALDRRWRFGLMVQPPSIHLRGRAEVRERYLMTDLGGEGTPKSTFFNASQGGLGAAAPAPWELRLGARYELYDWLIFALDGSFYGKTGSRKDPVVAVAPRTPDLQTGAVADLGAFTQDTWYRTYNGNLSLGMAATFINTFVLRCGLYSDLSSAPPVPRYTSSYRAPDVHRVGGAVSLGFLADGYDISLGIVGLFGRGDALSFSSDMRTDETYQRTHVTDRMFFFFLNGVKGAVTMLATQANEKLQEAREREAREQAKPEPDTEPPITEPSITEPSVTEPPARAPEPTAPAPGEPTD